MLFSLSLRSFVVTPLLFGFKTPAPALVQLFCIRNSCILSELGETAVMFVLEAVVLCALLGGAGAQPCPSQCSCSGTAVDCHGQSLRSVPRNIPRNAERL